MNIPFSRARSKWLFIIGIIAISAGFTAKHVISYPSVCLPSEQVKITPLL